MIGFLFYMSFNGSKIAYIMLMGGYQKIKRLIEHTVNLLLFGFADFFSVVCRIQIITARNGEKKS